MPHRTGGVGRAPARRRPAPLGSTYRLQLHGLGFDGARRAVGYLSALGVETLYLSPVLEAAPGSTHGYDVVDVTRLDPAHGSPSDYRRLLDEAEAHGLRVLLDIVPNHMAAAPGNPWWWDVLARGPRSEYAGVFDIDWDAHGGKVLLPVLGRPLADVIAGGELSVVDEDGESRLAYYEQRFPLRSAAAGRRPAELLEDQHYRLAYWRLGRRSGNYRRFFDVDGLIGVRVEDLSVHHATHRCIGRLAADRRVAGLRVDHVDGLADPAGYLARLRAELPADPAPTVVVEKILAVDESLPPRWATDGTSGYEFAARAGGLLIDETGAQRLASSGAAAAGGQPDFTALARQARREVLATLFPGQLAAVAARAVDAAEKEQPGSDLAVADMVAAVAELTAALTVYRTYLGTGAADPADRRRLHRAAEIAGAELDAEGRRALGRFVDGVLSGSGPADCGRPDCEWPGVARRWQQLTGAVAAKAVEDTALYRFDGLAATAEVGGDPASPATRPPDFHRWMDERRRRWPSSLSATTTHDTKRSEDVRARLSVLSEMPADWAARCDRWSTRHRDLRTAFGRRSDAPDAHDERLLYQTLVGVWPAGTAPDRELRERVEAYMLKAAREAKRRTSWLEPDERYERALAAFVRRLLSPRAEAFAADLRRLTERIGPAAACNSLALLALKATAPGVPDLYQGCERWSLTLVDPDNRRPVDFTGGARLLGDLDRQLAGGTLRPESLVRSWPDGRLKLWVTAALLRFRRSRRQLFADGAYAPLDVRGPAADHVVAFARRRRSQWSVTVVPRLVLGLAGPRRFPVGPGLWEGTAVVLPAGGPRRLTHVLTGASASASARRLAVGDVLRTVPLAVLHED